MMRWEWDRRIRGRYCHGVLAILMSLLVAPVLGQVAADTTTWPSAQPHGVVLEAGTPFPLEVAVVVLNTGIAQFDTRDARHTLRAVEARLLAATLRETLARSNRWGPVRVLPSASQFAALTLTGEIVHSDGRDLVLDIAVIDASNRVWLDERFRATAAAADYQRGADRVFEHLFVAVANRLARYAEALSAQQLEQLNTIARLRYALQLAPDVFEGYLTRTDEQYRLQRLPAENDPMLRRVEQIRNQEALFIDTVDEQYGDLRDSLGSTYALWRRSSFEQAEYLESYTRRASGREVRANRGSFAAMQQVYSTYRSVRIQEQDLFELATGFDNETAPTVMQTGDRVVRLTGTLDEQYREWRDILARIIRLERGVTP